jgi:signal transduction histidine kinase
MRQLESVVQIYEAGEPGAAFQAMIGTLSAPAPLHCAAWVEPDGSGTRHLHPVGFNLPAELLGLARHTTRPSVFPLSSLLPGAAEQPAGAELLLLPLPKCEPELGSILLIGGAGDFDGDLDGWAQLAHALAAVAMQRSALDATARERDELRRRVEEIEALNVLGLAANRTLVLDDVLDLVARFTRTLLGANYVSVHTTENGLTRLCAAAGIEGVDDEEAPDPFAARVVEAGKPLNVGPHGAFQPGALPFHSAQGMQTGLGVPLSLYGETFGALVVGYRRTYELTPRDTRLALTLAGHAAVAINNARLHKAVAQHSAELERAYEQLSELTRAKERFYNAISHDLRTPVTAVKGYTELLLAGVAGEMPDKAQRYVQNTHRAAQSLLALVNDLLDFAKLEAGKVEVELRECPLSEIVADAVSAVEPQAAAKGLGLVLPDPGEMPALITDPKRARQVLVNLLSNAVKFTTAGTVSVEIDEFENGRGDDSGPQIQIRVRDTGPGIAPEDRERVFAEFEQVAGSEGTGLGLPISRKLARLLGGDLRLAAEVGEGSTFVFSLPATEQAVQGATVAA